MMRATARSPFGRPMAYGPHATHGCCPHDRRVLARMVDAIGREHVADWCMDCLARTENISRADLTAADIDWRTVRPVLVRREGAA
jgi:hypothetical protein